jgi:hypothetical protein
MPSRIPSVVALSLAVILLAAGCSSSAGSDEPPEPADSVTTSAEGGQEATEDPGDAGAAGDFGDPATAACDLITDEEAQAFLEFELSEPKTGQHQEVNGSSICTWSGADGLDFRTIQTSIVRSAWIAEESREMRPDVSAQWFWDINTEPSEFEGETIEPLFNIEKPGPAGLGPESYFGPLGLCVLEGPDLWWCTSAGGLGADLENPQAVKIMEEMAALVDSRIQA